MKTYQIEIDGVTINLTAKQVAKLHDDLTKIYNEHYEEITAE
jgi:hypothetical protein